MPWKLPSQPHRRFKRNPLVAVIEQLRFDPILKIASGVPDFQDKVRSRFPLYEERDVQQLQVEVPEGPRVHLHRAKEHRFRARSEPTTAVLTDNSVALEYRAHQHRDVLFQDVALVMGALTSTFENVSPTRLGLRYVNVVDRDRVARESGTPVSWSELLDAEFLRVPAGLADLDRTRFVGEITSELPTGEMTLRYGLLPTAEGSIAFRLDVDRFREEGFAVADVENNIRAFADDIFQVFMAAAGGRLVQWMEEQA